MANLFNLLTNVGNNIKNKGSNLWNKITTTPEERERQFWQGSETNKQPVKLDMELLSEDGGTDIQKTVDAAQKTTPLSLSDRLFGRTIEKNFQKYNPETKQVEMTTVSSTRPGFFNSLDQGMNENYYNAFNPNNLGNNLDANGNKKGFAYRLGEGLGTITRALGGGLGDSYIAGTEGLDAAMKRQSYRTGDQMYREALRRQGVDVSKIGGLITDEMFKNYSLNNYRFSNLENKKVLAEMKDNTSRAKYILDALNNGIMTPQMASTLIAEYGITNADLQVSDKTRATDSKIKLDEIKGETAKVNAAANKTRADSYAKVNNAILGEDGGTVTTVRVISPDGKIGTIPAANLENAKKAGYREL